MIGFLALIGAVVIVGLVLLGLRSVVDYAFLSKRRKKP